MKPFAKKYRIACPRCFRANIDLTIKGSKRGDGTVSKAIREISECNTCQRPKERKELSPEKLKVVNQLNETMIKPKNMYRIVKTAKGDLMNWHWIEWAGGWRDREAMSQLGRALNDACRITTFGKDESETWEAGYVLDTSREGEKSRMFVREDQLANFESVLEDPIFIEAFRPFARISDDKMDLLKKAFED